MKWKIKMEMKLFLKAYCPERLETSYKKYQIVKLFKKTLQFDDTSSKIGHTLLHKIRIE